MNLSFESKFWPLLKGFCKNHSTQNALLNMIEKWKEDFTCGAEQKLLGITIAKDLNFQSHTKLIIKTVNQKLNSLIRVTPCITDFDKKVRQATYFIR